MRILNRLVSGFTRAGHKPPVDKLKNSGATVKMPDCARFRADGSNEVAGVTPDVLVPWADRDTPYQRVKKLEAAFEDSASRPGLPKK